MAHSFIIDLDDYTYLNYLDQEEIDQIVKHDLKKPPPISEELLAVMQETKADTN